MERVAVVFRRWRDTGDVIALFPELPADIHGRYCDSYMHVGQHGGADYHGVIRQTVPAAPGECAALSVELKRASWRHHERRRQAARAFRDADTGCGRGTTSPTKSEGEP